MVPHTPAAATNRMPCLQSPPSVLPCQLGDASDALSPVLNSPFCGAYKAPRTISHLPLASSPLTFLCHCPKPYFPTILNSQINFPHFFADRTFLPALPLAESQSAFGALQACPHSRQAVFGDQLSPPGWARVSSWCSPPCTEPTIYLHVCCLH